MTKDIDAQFLCKDCARYNLCEYYHKRKKDSYICKYFHLSETYGMTNGEVIKAMFPNASFHYHKASDIVDDYVSVCINDCDTQQDYSMAWWNAPYKKEGE